MTTPVKKANRRIPSEIDDQAEKASDEAILIAVIDGKSYANWENYLFKMKLLL